MAAIKDIIAKVVHDMSAPLAGSRKGTLSPRDSTSRKGTLSPRDFTSRKDLAALWQDICPQGTQVVDLKEGAALIHVDSSARLVHLNARHSALLKTVQAQCPQVKELKFKVGKVTP
ncbi:MAG: hypothetical protein HYZ86_02385 [Candidatus Omnitrophica bacterium]|nr:hypothetical protein [Candidatus Omnitrophota bacterium]